MVKQSESSGVDRISSELIQAGEGKESKEIYKFIFSFGIRENYHNNGNNMFKKNDSAWKFANSLKKKLGIQ